MIPFGLTRDYKKNYSMKKFDEFILNEQLKESERLYEKLVTFGGKAYPKFGNVVILAGGAGSGKGFIKDNLLGIEGWVFDVDKLKELAIKAPKFGELVKEKTGKNLSKVNLKNPQDVSDIHYIVNDIFGVDEKKLSLLYSSILVADPSRKPNIIFDVTLKDLRKLQKLTDFSKKLGYESENIHIVWVVNDVEMAKKQNTSRDRVVPEEILVNTHRGASATMADIINMGDKLGKYMNGDLVFVFSKAGVDGKYVTSKHGGGYLEDINYVFIKKSGKPIKKMSQIAREVIMKIKEYTPGGDVWK